MKRSLLVLCCASLPLACAADAGGPSDLRGATAPLSAPSLTPVPCGTVDGKKEYTWNGTRVELLLGDALAGCADNAADVAADMTDFPLADKALRDVIFHMKEALPSGSQAQPVFKWVGFRGDKTNNCDADNIALPKAAPIVQYQVQETVYLNQPPNASVPRAWMTRRARAHLSGTALPSRARG